MNFDDPAQRRVFFDVHRELPREAPGNAGSTHRAVGLPASAWLDGYYGPMEDRLDTLEARYADDPMARAVFGECREEIAVYRQHGDCYGYAFVVAHKRR